MQYFTSEVTQEEIRREKDKARRLRNTQWWKRRRSTGVCHFCGRKFPPGELTMEHITRGEIDKGQRGTRLQGL
jgi:hypothetical protein